MTEPGQVRGYTLIQAQAALRSMLGPGITETREAELSQGAQIALKTATPASWVPASAVSELYCALAELEPTTPELVRERMVGCGEMTARAAMSTYLKPVLRFVTVPFLARALPRLWARDSTVGTIEAVAGATRLTCYLTGMRALAHITPVSLGFVRFTFSRMGVHVAEVDLWGWSPRSPRRDRSGFVLHWLEKGR